MTPAITIGIMTYNYGRYIKEAIESVLAQGHTDWELIISDDASTDDTEQIVTLYLSDPRIRYVRHTANIGQARNWGYVLDQGSAPLIAVLHADDYWLPDTLETVLSAFASDPQLDMLYGNWWRQVEGKTKRILAKREKPHVFSGHDEYRYQVSRHTWLPSATFLTRRAANLAGKPSSRLIILLDTEFFLRVALHARRVRALSEPVLVYREHKESATAQGIIRMNEEKALVTEICRSHLKTFPHLHGSLTVLRQASANSIFSYGVTMAVQGQVQEGRILMRRAIRLSPNILCHPKRLLDYLLCGSGPINYRVFQHLHRKRLST